jgi:hypothetical protein
MAYTPAVANGLNPEFGLANPTNTPGGGISQQFVSTIYDRPRFEMMDAFNRHVGYVGFATYAKTYGWAQGTSNPTVGHYEVPATDNIVNFAAVISAGASAGVAATMALAAGSMFNGTLTVGGVATHQSYAQIGDIIELAGRKQVYVTNKLQTGAQATNHQLVLVPAVATDVMATICPANSKGFVVSNLSGEGTGLPFARPNRIIKYTNQFSIIKVAATISGTELTNTVNFRVNGGDNTAYAFIKTEELKRFEQQRSNNLLFGNTVNNVTVLSAGLGHDVAVTQTEGLLPFAYASAMTDQYTGGSYTTADIDAMSTLIVNQRGSSSKRYCGWVGYDFFLGFENSFQALLVNNLDVFTSMTNAKGNEKTELDTMLKASSDVSYLAGIQSVKKGGITYVLHNLPELSNVNGAGNTAFAYRGIALFTPDGETINKQTGKPKPNIGYEYKALNGYSREVVLGNFAGAGVGGDNTPFGKAVGPNDVNTMFLVTEAAGHFACANSMVLQTL